MNKETYKKAGVDILKAEKVKNTIKHLAQSTHTPNVLKEIGLFSGFFRLDLEEVRQPVLVSSIDGVGTKVKIAEMCGRYDTIGVDLVNHCINDIMVCGAKPLFFMDYIAADKLSVAMVQGLIEGITTACRDADCALLGGETAEMPGVYLQDSFDFAGAITGIVEQNEILDGSQIKRGDILLGVASNGAHTNGYSLIRRILLESGAFTTDSYIEDVQSTLGEELLRIHKSYQKLITGIRKHPGLHGISHVTGGGIIGNTKRLLSNNLKIKIDWSSWQTPAIFGLIQQQGRISDKEMQNVFNMGIGLVLVIEKKEADSILKKCSALGESTFIIGEIV